MQALGLAVRADAVLRVGPLVPVQPQPAQVVENARLGLARRALGVGVLDAKDERPVVAVGQQPVEERRPRVADVQLTGRRGSEADSHHVLRAGAPHPAPASARFARAANLQRLSAQ